MRRIAVAGVLVMTPILFLITPAGASHFYTSGWRHKHYSYPSVPSGYSAIVATFGLPCNSQVNDNYTSWVAQDDGKAYPVRYHYKLGGWGPYYGGDQSPGPSSNLNNDVRGHIRNNHVYKYVKRGIWGYNCRYISGTSKYSTHAWGIAVDINSAYEHVGSAHKHCHSIPTSVSDIWKGHRWTHGVIFGDCMHFQYATNY